MQNYLALKLTPDSLITICELILITSSLELETLTKEDTKFCKAVEMFF